MDRHSHPRSSIAALLAAATLAAATLSGCGTTASTAPTAPTANAGVASTSVDTSLATTQAVTTVAALPAQGGHRGSVAKTVPKLPASWPRDVPVPAGVILGSTASATRWSVLLVEPGSAGQVRRSTLAFYVRAGFNAVNGSVLNSRRRQITLVVENRDHSATRTNLVIGVTTR